MNVGDISIFHVSPENFEMHTRNGKNAKNKQCELEENLSRELKIFIEEKITVATSKLQEEIVKLQTTIKDLVKSNKELISFVSECVEQGRPNDRKYGANSSAVKEFTYEREMDKSWESSESTTSDETVVTNSFRSKNAIRKDEKLVNDTENESIDTPDDQKKKRSIANSKRAKKQNQYVMGTNQVPEDNTFGVKPKIWIHVRRCKQETSVEHIETYLKNKFQDKRFDITKMESKGAYASFRVGADQELRDVLYNPDTWPLGVAVRRYFFRSPRSGEFSE